MAIFERCVGLWRALVPSALVLAMGLTLPVFSGCAGEPAPEEPRLGRRVIDLEDVPEPAVKTARETLPGITFENIWANVDGDNQIHSYELRGRNEETGRIREVRVSAEGEILEVE